MLNNPHFLQNLYVPNLVRRINTKHRLEPNSNSAKCCHYYIDKLGGIENMRVWLEKHVEFNHEGDFWFE